MEYLKPFQLIMNWIIKLLGMRTSQEKERVQRVIDYIDTCLDHMNKIMGYEEHAQPVVEQSRMFLQGAHHELPKHLDKVATAKECDIIKKSLMSARIYYHALQDGAIRDKQIKNDYQERYYAYKNNIYDQKEYRQSSYEAFLKQLVNDGREMDSAYMNHERQKIREVCQEDVSRIMLLKERLKTRRVLA